MILVITSGDWKAYRKGILPEREVTKLSFSADKYNSSFCDPRIKYNLSLQRREFYKLNKPIEFLVAHQYRFNE